jgi:hypothetical protein
MHCVVFARRQAPKVVTEASPRFRFGLEIFVRIVLQKAETYVISFYWPGLGSAGLVDEGAERARYNSARELRRGRIFYLDSP